VIYPVCSTTFQEAYNAAERSEKSKISKMIVSYIRNQNPPGRFLEKDAETNQWNDMDDKRAIEKTSQAIRECIRKESAKASKEALNGMDPSGAAWLTDSSNAQWALAVDKMDLSAGIATINSNSSVVQRQQPLMGENNGIGVVTMDNSHLSQGGGIQLQQTIQHNNSGGNITLNNINPQHYHDPSSMQNVGTLELAQSSASPQQDRILGRFQHLNMNEQHHHTLDGSVDPIAAYSNSLQTIGGDGTDRENALNNAFEDFIRNLKTIDPALYASLPQSQEANNPMANLVGGSLNHHAGGINQGVTNQDSMGMMEPDPIPFFVQHNNLVNLSGVNQGGSDEHWNPHRSQSAPALSLEAKGLTRSKKSLKTINMSFHNGIGRGTINEEWPDDQKNATFTFNNNKSSARPPNRFNNFSNFGSLLEGGEDSMSNIGSVLGSKTTGAGPHPGINLPDFGVSFDPHNSDLFTPGIGIGGTNGNFEDSFDLRRKQRTASNGSGGGELTLSRANKSSR